MKKFKSITEGFEKDRFVIPVLKHELRALAEKDERGTQLMEYFTNTSSDNKYQDLTIIIELSMDIDIRNAPIPKECNNFYCVSVTIK